MRKTLCVVLTILLGVPALAQADPSAVNDSFEAYRKALLAGDGVAVSERVTKGSLDYYRELADHALTLDRAGLQRLHVTDRMTVLRLRDSLQRQQLVEMSGGELIAYAVDNGWIDKDGTARLRVGNYVVDGDFASVKVLGANGQESPFALEFAREDGQWRLDLVEALMIGRFAVDYVIKQSGMTEDEFVMFALESVTGRKPDPALWDPPQ